MKILQIVIFSVPTECVIFASKYYLSQILVNTSFRVKLEYFFSYYTPLSKLHLRRINYQTKNVNSTVLVY